ncbi:MAG: hypothetical protein KF686_00260 [Ramlibacter sp.]|nr:hypothetical protein [Ramlibacter sp.]
MKIIKNLFAKSSEAAASILPTEAPSQSDGHEDSRVTELGPQSATRRELVRVLVRDTLRYCGIPEGWVECQVLVVNTSRGDTHLHARLVIRHWDEQLLRYAMAFERRLMGEIEHFEPQASQWLHSITWQFKADDCPYPDMPPAQAWAGAVPEVALLDDSPQVGFGELSTPEPEPEPEPQAEPEPVDELQEDLARLFAVRDSALAELKAIAEDPPRN